MLVAGCGATKKEKSALPQLTVQLCAGCLVTEGVIQERDENISSCPQSRITHPCLRRLLWILQKTTEFYPRKGNSFGKETGFAVRCCLTGRPSAFLEKKWFQAPGEGRVAPTALRSQRPAERRDCLGTSTNTHSGLEHHTHLWLSCQARWCLCGGEHTAHLYYCLCCSEPLRGLTGRSFSVSRKPQAETQSSYTRQLQDCGLFILFCCYPGLHTHLSTGTCRTTSTHI